VTTPGSSFQHLITVNVYAVDHSGADPAVGALLATKTIDATIPYRPSHSAQCPDATADNPFGGKWFDPVLGYCVHGYAFNLTFDLSSLMVTLPGEVIVSVAYNTADHGAAPIHLAGPYNSLNLSIDPAAATIGSDANGDEVFWNTTFGGFYCDGGVAGTGTFRRDFAVGCWTGYTPILAINADALDHVRADGHITSPAGAFPAAPTHTGKAAFNVDVHYRDHTNTLDGHANFKFDGDIDFHSTDLGNLSISGNTFQLTGSGTIAGRVGVFTFTVTAVDGSFNGGTASDKYRVRIIDASDAVVYDNIVTSPLTDGKVDIRFHKT
jgi:hypothetical protein